jgi:hypothetical protein
MKQFVLSGATAALLALPPTPAAAQEVFGGIYSHDVKTGITKSGFETGTSILVGVRGGRIEALRFVGRPSPYAFGSVNSEGNTNFATAGLGWKIGDRFYARPGIGLAVHDGPSHAVPGDGRIDFGSRILFELEMGVGAQLSEAVSVEANWVHLSHAKLFSPQNPGIDNIGIRLNYRFR